MLAYASTSIMDNLSGFDPSTMTYFASQMAHPSINGGGAGTLQLDDMMLMELPDQQSTYGYAGSDDLNLLQQQQQPLTTPPLKRFNSGYEDFSDVVSAFDQHLPGGVDALEPETSSIDRDHKLLSFSSPSFDYALLDYGYRRTTLSLTAQLAGMFLLAESPWAATDSAQPPASELTCYRRNLFQITGELMIPRTLRYIMTDSGEQIPIIGQELVVSATESTEGNPVKIISVPWKTPAGPNPPAPEDKVEREPPSIPLDLMNVPDTDAEYASFPFQWKRLQFRIATANNGRRKELQQHFVVKLKLLANLATGGQIPIAEMQSSPVIVRGRSPRNFQSRKDMPLNGSGSVRKNSNINNSNTVTEPARSATGDSVKKPIPLKLDNTHTSAPMAAPTSRPPLFSPATSQDFFDWNAPLLSPHHGAATAIPTSGVMGNGNNNNNDIYASSSPELTRNNSSRGQPIPPAPINLSLVEDESPISPTRAPATAAGMPSTSPPTRTNSHNHGPIKNATGTRGRANTGASNRSMATSPPTSAGAIALPAINTSSHTHNHNNAAAAPASAISTSAPAGAGAPPSKKPNILQRAPSFTLNTLMHSSSPDINESADLLYEYFPLGMDDWMPPVDAVYRPHVVHHVKMPMDMRWNWDGYPGGAHYPGSGPGGHGMGSGGGGMGAMFGAAAGAAGVGAAAFYGGKGRNKRYFSEDVS